MAITLQTIESLPLVEEVNENTSLVGWDGEKTVRVASDMVGGSGLPEGGEPYKQLVTDGEGKTVWEERLAYERFTKGASLEPREYGFNEDHGLNFLALSDFHPTVNDGDVLQMSFDGQNYTFTLTWNDQFNSFAFGNVAKMEGNGDTGEPFVGTLDSKNGFVLATFDSAANHTIGIELNNKTIHKIPSKYIPNIVVRYDGIKYSCNIDYDQFYD